MSSILASLANAVPRINREGHPFIIAFAVATLVLGWLVAPLGWIGFGLTIWCIAFFRDPPRVTPIGADLVVAPADGRVSQVGPAAPPPELGLPPTGYVRVSIFMNVFNCHVNRAPIGGRIVRIAYTPGKFVNAELDKASEHNERNGLVIARDNGAAVGVVQIAGLVARRIVCWVKEGETAVAGERFGMIRFGSRLDVYLPEGTVPLVAVGQTTVAGETVLADLAGRAPGRVYRVS
jgi:phosphatidylserine decarboxylase